uniref:Odorant-binding protein 3 n=1 Tax=Plutella xylostella TaxID=51655 RepID=A0A168QJB8_PLUXY|nr:odorant-binding protein 3 [Plutella xylostella]
MFLASLATLVLITFTLSSGKMKAEEPRTREMPDMSSSSSVSFHDGNDEHAEDDMMGIMTHCNETFRFDPAYWQSLNESGTFPDENDKNPKCFIRCVLEGTRVASLDSVFDAARAAEVFAGERGGRPMDDLETLAKNCADDRRETCKCERAYGFMKCLMEAEIETYEVYKADDS